MNFMQKRIKEKLATKYSKIEVLINYWDKMIWHLGIKAPEYGDVITKQLCRNIILIPKEVRYAVLKQYVSKCSEQHSIAFFQWRLKNPQNDLRELQEVLNSRIEYFFRSIDKKKTIT